MHSLTDEIVWQSCLQGDKKAFEELYGRFYPLLYNYGRKILPDIEQVKDTIQNYFIKLISNRGSLSEVSSVKGYLLKGFRNTLYNTLKSEESLQHFIMELDENMDSESVFFFEIPEKHYSSDCLIMRGAFKMLSFRQQEILYLYYVMELNHTEISTILDINYQSSKNLLNRSLAKLKDVFLEQKNNSSIPTYNEEFELEVFSKLTKNYNLPQINLRLNSEQT